MVALEKNGNGHCPKVKRTLPGVALHRLMHLRMLGVDGGQQLQAQRADGEEGRQGFM